MRALVFQLIQLAFMVVILVSPNNDHGDSPNSILLRRHQLDGGIVRVT